MRVIVIGGMNLDLLGMVDAPLTARDSNPGRVISRPGGVGRNIAARLRGLGVETALLTALGNDDRATLLRNACRRDGIDLSLSVQTACPAPCYLCIHDEKGDMALAVNDMAAMAQLTPQTLSSLLPRINGYDGCVLDANLSAEALDFLAVHVTVPLFLDPVSYHKAPRVLPILPRLAAIKPNRMEAQALTGEADPAQAAQALLSMGVKNVFISLGGEGVYYANAQAHGLQPALPLPAAPLTGAGDALCAGLMRALLSGKPIQACAQDGVQSAYQVLLASIGA